jgi:hypothetical protein
MFSNSSQDREMNGRDRAYTLTAPTLLGKSTISVVFSDRCFSDRCGMVVATAVLPHDRLATIEPVLIEFLNSATCCIGLK